MCFYLFCLTLLLSRSSPVSSFMQLDGENQCLKAAQDCGLYEKCGSLRSEYVLACTKRVPGTNRCNQHKCHRALRRFLERVPEEYSLGVLFCPCTNTLCGERRRKTIVPSCSYQDMEGLQHNCLHQQSFCRREDICRLEVKARNGAWADSDNSPGLCLRAYAGLIGTIMTPNYISNSSADVSLWCNCEGSGNQWQDCQRLQRLFTHNACLPSPSSLLHHSHAACSLKLRANK
uniref:GDNF family receptor alpha 3 n=1 Tax=Acanthochromis polyacanthus TaxID=80966 RepID=A0A3Q1G511_9TELE